MFLCSPQALIYPLTVASKSTTTARHNAANKILKNMCEHSNTLVQQAMMVSPEPAWAVTEPGCLITVPTTVPHAPSGTDLAGHSLSLGLLSCSTGE